MLGVTEILLYVRSWIWNRDLDKMSPWPRAGMRTLRTFWAIMRDLRSGDLNLRAMSLVYTTILSLVPLLAVSFSVLKGFGVHEALETAIMGALEPLGQQGIEIGQRIIEFVDNVKVGLLGSLGVALLLYTVISLMQKIEVAFNFIWLVPQERAFAQRFADYLSIIVIGPFLVFLSLGLSTSLQSTTFVQSVKAIEPFGSLLHIGGALLPFVLVVAAFTFIYVFIPNTRVKWPSAFAGALVAGILWNLTSVLFAKFVVSSAQYTAIYSAFAALIIFMLWLYIGWLVLLAGSSVAFYHQNPEQVTLARGDAKLSSRLVERLTFALLAEIANQFATTDPQTSTEALATKVGVQAGLAEQQIDTLARAGMVTATADNPKRWMPARAPETINLSDVLAAVRSNGETLALPYDSLRTSAAAEKLLSDIDQRQTDVLSKLSLADLIDSSGRAPSADQAVARLHVKQGAGDAAE